MNFSFDHLVWFSEKPEEAVSPLIQQGIHAVNGGRHQSWGTYNSLAYFDLSYIEFLGIENLAIAQQHEDNRLVTQIVEQLSNEKREGPATIAIRTDRIEELAVKLQEDGLNVYGPLPGERVRADGEVIRWSLLFAENDADELPLPFFIQWDKSDVERFKQLKEQGLIVEQNPKLESVGFVIRNLDKTIETWGRMFNLKPCKEFIDTNLNAHCKQLEMPGTKLLFCSPVGEGLAEKVLNERGESPFLVNLTDSNQVSFLEMMNGYWKFQSST